MQINIQSIHYGLFVLAACFFAAMIGVSAFFFVVQNSAAKIAKRAIGVLATTSAAAVLWMLWTEPSHNWISLLVSGSLFLYALVVFVSALKASAQSPLDFAFSSRQSDSLLSAGPYRWIRHPFYSSYVASWAAAAIGAPSLITIGVACVMIPIYFVAASREEHAFLSSDLRQEYLSYQQRTSMFVPWPRIESR